MTWRLELAGIGALFVAQLLRLVTAPEASVQSSLPLALATGVFMLSAVGAGFTAGASLRIRPLTTDRGKWAMRLAVFNMVLLPLVWLLSWPANLLGIDLSVSWGMPFFPFWAGSLVGAVGLALSGVGERKQGALTCPLLLAAALVTFFFGDMVPMP